MTIRGRVRVRENPALDRLILKLVKAYLEARSDEVKERRGWRRVGDKFGISSAMAYRIAVRGYEPADARIRCKLGLPALIPAPACSHCGEVHVSKRCPKRRRWRRIADIPTGVLRKLLEERVEISG